MARLWRIALALIEPIVVFLLATVGSALLLRQPFALSLSERFGEPPALLLLRFLPLVLLALSLDLALRRRGLGAWGLFTPWGGPGAGLASVVRLLTLGGLPALVLTYLSPPEQRLFDGASFELSALLSIGAALLVPLFGQELFLVGYAHRRLSDALPRFAVAVVVAAFFALTHAQHAATGALGITFVAAMALQGVVWSMARSAGAPLPLLMLAHLLLLIAYEWPLPGAAAILAGAFIVAPGWMSWIRWLSGQRVEAATPT